MCARSASRRVGSRGGVSAAVSVFACRNSMSVSRIARPGAESAALETVLSSSRMLPGHGYAWSAASLPAKTPWRRAAIRSWRNSAQGSARPAPECRRPLAKRRQTNRERVDAVVQVFAEAAVADELFERAIGRRYQAEVDLDRLLAAEPLETAIFEHAQQLGLRDERQVADFVEEQRAVVGQFQPPRFAVVRAGERALLVAEDFGLEQRVGQRGAVDRLELFAAAAAQLVNHPRDDFLARAGRPQDQDGNVGLGGGADPLEDDQHLLVAADHLAKALDRRRLIFGADGRAPLEERVQQRRQVPLVRATGEKWGRSPAPGARRRTRRVRRGSCRCPSAGARTSTSAIRRRRPLPVAR